MTGRVSDEQLAADLAKLEADARLEFENAQIAVPYLRELQEARAALAEAWELIAAGDADGAGLVVERALGGGS